MEEGDDNVQHVQYKVILLGDASVGKTSVAMRFTQGHFKKAYKQTIGLDFFIKRLVLPGDLYVGVQVWDIGGHSIGSKMLSNYIHGSHAILLVYDITNYQSFQNLEDWMRLVRKVYSRNNLPYVALIGNKGDLDYLGAVSEERHNAFADENDFHSFQMSAKSGDNVRSVFHRVVADLAGVTLTKPDLQISHQVVKAEIIDHEKDDHSLVERESRKKKSSCTVS